MPALEAEMMRQHSICICRYDPAMCDTGCGAQASQPVFVHTPMRGIKEDIHRHGVGMMR